jgi:MarR family transcriptional regulator, transcriptional regulator for hemolysin
MAEIREVWMHAHNVLRSARHIVNEDLRPLNLSSAEGNILLHLLIQGQELGQEQLAEQLDISKPAVTRALVSLEAKGFITRHLDLNDRRVHRVRLTDRAREIGPTIEQTYNQLYDIARQGFSKEELDHFIELFSRLSDNFMRAQGKRNLEDRSAV